ncbi:conserved hypothetical protein [Ricinus communis]|uniref:Uncharacterized protein n=1 Tax=Ricinus communis TaxID=3988 RepID=B9RH73_RICCO|nr:conserved hypothetical protein [Ricinus communis]
MAKPVCFLVIFFMLILLVNAGFLKLNFKCFLTYIIMQRRQLKPAKYVRKGAKHGLGCVPYHRTATGNAGNGRELTMEHVTNDTWSHVLASATSNAKYS